MSFYLMMKRLIMTKRRNIIVLSIAFIVSAGIWINALSRNNKKKKNHLSAKVFEALNGWGYDILVDDTVFIHQESVPVLAGKKGFLKKQQAEQTAQLIINKIERGQPPTITTFDLKQIFSFNNNQNGQPNKSK